MHLRGVLFVVACVATQGCSRDEAAAPAAKADPKGSGSATKPRDGLELAKAPEAVGQPVTARVAVLIAKDGSLSVARIEAGVAGDLAVDSITGAPVAQLADLPASLAALTPPTPEPPPPEALDEEAPDDDLGGDGTAMTLDEGKMGKRDADRAESRYEMRRRDVGPAIAREEAIAAARQASILGVLAEEPCLSSGLDDSDIYGGLLGNEPGATGGWGYVDGPVGPAGLRAISVMDAAACGDFPLVLADARAPAARVVEVLSSLPHSQLAISADGGAHARTLAATFSFRAGTRPAELPTPEVGFTLGPDGARGSAYRGRDADAGLWTWDGRSGGIADAFHAASAVTQLRDAEVRIRVDGDVTAGALIAGVSALLAGDAKRLAFGEPVELVHEQRSGFESRAPPAPRPSVRIGQPTVTGNLDAAIIRRYIKRNLLKISYCYEKALLATPGVRGTVTSRFQIAANGTVTRSEATGVHDDVSSCVRDVIETIEFPKPKGGGVVKVTSYPFTFAPGP